MCSKFGCSVQLSITGHKMTQDYMTMYLEQNLWKRNQGSRASLQRRSLSVHVGVSKNGGSPPDDDIEPLFIMRILGTPRYWKLPFRLVRRPTPLGEHGGYGARTRGKAGSVTNGYSFNLGHYRSRIQSNISVPLGYSDYFRKRIC